MLIVRPLVTALAVVLGLSLMGAAPASAKERVEVVTITHAPTAPTAVVGTGLGTVRTYFVPTAVSGRKSPTTGYMSGTLTTIATGFANGQEARAANLVFVVGSEPNQLVIGGLSLYNTDLSTIAAGSGRSARSSAVPGSTRAPVAPQCRPTSATRAGGTSSA